MSAGMRVCHAVFSMELGGMERVVLSLVEEGRRLGQGVSVVCVMTRGVLAGGAEAMGAEVRCIGKPAGIKLSAIGALAGVFGELKPDVVHTHQIGVLFYAGPAARRAGVPVVVHTEHGKHFGPGVSAKTRWMAWWAARYARRFFCVSGDIAREAAKYGVVRGAKVGCVANGIDTGAFARAAGEREAVRAELGIAAGARVIGTVGRLSEIKRQDVLVEAFANVRETHRDARLLLVGEGPMRGELEGLVAKLGLGGAVIFAGYQSAPERFLGAMDVFALTSRSEGMPLSILEAWAAGVPVVASRVGGIPEMITEGETGMMVEAGDVGGFAGAFSRVLDDTAAAAKMRARASALVMERFDTGAMAREYLRHYTQLLAGTGGGMAVAGEAG